MKFEDYLNESKTVTIDIDFMGDDSAIRDIKKTYGITIKKGSGQTALATGDKDKLLKYLLSSDYDMDMSDVRSLFPELLK